MRIVLTYPNGQRASVDTRDPELAARWMWEHIAPLATLNASFGPSEIAVWADSEDEVAAIGRHTSGLLNRETLLKLAEGILKALPQEDK